MSIELIDKIKPKNNGSFPLVEAHDIQMPDGSRLDTWDGKGTIPYFDLVELGLPDVPVEGGEKVTVETDTADMIEALSGGAVRFRLNLKYGMMTLLLVFTLHDISSPDGNTYFCSHALDLLGGMPMLIGLAFESGKITAYCTILEQDSEESEAVEIPTFDLVTLGLPPVPMDGSQVSAQMDTTEIMAALDKGAVKFIASFLFGTSAVTAEVVMNKVSASALGMYICSYALDFNDLPMIFNLLVAEEGAVVAFYTNLATVETPATSIDLSALDSEGKVVETFADGTAKTTTMEFDADGNPVKITDGDGNVTTLTW